MSGQRHSPDAVVVPIIVVVVPSVVPKLVVVDGQAQGVVEEEEEVEEAWVKSCTRLLFCSLSGSGVARSPFRSIAGSMVVSVQAGLVGPWLALVASISSTVEVIVCPANCVDKGSFVPPRSLDIVLTSVSELGSTLEFNSAGACLLSVVVCISSSFVLVESCVKVSRVFVV